MRSEGFYLKSVIFLSDPDLKVALNEPGRLDVYGPDAHEADTEQNNWLRGDLPGERARNFRADALRLASQSDPILDNLPTFVEKDGDIMISAARITSTQAPRADSPPLPRRVRDPGYVGTESEGERTYKWAAHQRFVENFDGGRGRALLGNDEADLIGEISRVLGSAINLLATQEYIALREGLANREAARRYLYTLLDLVEAGHPGGAVPR